MHHIGVMITGEDIPGTAHICRKLVDLVEGSINDGRNRGRVTEITLNEVIGNGRRVFVVPEIHTANPTSLSLQSVHEVTADKPPGAAN